MNGLRYRVEIDTLVNQARPFNRDDFYENLCII